MSPARRLASERLLVHRSEIAAALVEREFERRPELELRYGRHARDRSLQDVGYHLSHLAQALVLERPALFVDYIAWVKALLGHRKIAASDLAFHLECLADVLGETLPDEEGAVARAFITAALEALPSMPIDSESMIHDASPLSLLAHRYLEALRRGDRQLASRLILDAVAAGTAVKQIYLHVFQPVQCEIGRLWQTNRITVAEEHYCTAATQLIMSQLYPHVFAASGERKAGALVATCVAGDLHELGVRMVADIFEMEGWNTFFLGASTPHAAIVDTLVERRADVLAISATIALHLDAVRDLIHAVRADSRLGAVRLLVGGRPFNRNPELWRQVGADGTAPDAHQAIALVGNLINGQTI